VQEADFETIHHLKKVLHSNHLSRNNEILWLLHLSLLTRHTNDANAAFKWISQSYSASSSLNDSRCAAGEKISL